MHILLRLHTKYHDADRGSNGGANSTTQLASVTLNVSSGNWHRMKVVFNGSTHQIYLDDVLYITVTDSTYTAAGYIGLRCSNSTGNGYTGFFDNFGIAPALTGTWVSANQSLAGAGTYGNSVIAWRDISTDPGNTDTILVESPGRREQHIKPAPMAVLSQILPLGKISHQSTSSYE